MNIFVDELASVRGDLSAFLVLLRFELCQDSDIYKFDYVVCSGVSHSYVLV